MSAALTSVAMATRPSVMQARRNGEKQRGQCRAEKETRAEYQADTCLHTDSWTHGSTEQHHAIWLFLLHRIVKSYKTGCF